jgi:nucleoside 2-deoxyribosyltransferase
MARTPLRPTSKSLAPADAYTVYFAGELFSAKHLLGNAYLAEAIHACSHGRYLCRLPQDLEQRSLHPHEIRDTDLHALLACDLAVFNFDGPELDSGTVVEFMCAKFADIPCVLLRSDFRAAGDQGPGRDPWNLMASFFPRCATVAINSMAAYKQAQAKVRQGAPDDVARLAGQHSSAIAQQVCEQIAARVVRALERVRAKPPVLPKRMQSEVYAWLAMMPGFRGEPKALRKVYDRLREQKAERKLL